MLEKGIGVCESVRGKDSTMESRVKNSDILSLFMSAMAKSGNFHPTTRTTLKKSVLLICRVPLVPTERTNQICPRNIHNPLINKVRA